MAIPKELPNYEYLSECFFVTDGILHWNKRPLKHFGSDRACRQFNTRSAGKPCPQKIPEGSRYLVVKLTGYGNIKQHRIIASLYNGRTINPEEIVDHLDGNTLNNGEDNIRLVDYEDNSRNQKLWNTNTSGIKGVTKLLNKDGSLYYRAQWWDGEKRKNKSFSFSKYGEDEAFRLACEVRKAEIEKLGGYIER